MRTHLLRTQSADGVVFAMLDRGLSREPTMSAAGAGLLPVEGVRNGS